MGQAASMCRFRGCRYKKNKNKNQQQQQQQHQPPQQQLFNSTASSSSLTSPAPLTTTPVLQIPAAGTAVVLTPPDSPSGEIKYMHTFMRTNIHTCIPTIGAYG